MSNTFQRYLADAVSGGQMASIVSCPDALTTYIAFAEPGTPAAAAAWQAKKVVQSSGTAPYTITTTWADGNNGFDNVATDITALSYS